MFKRAHPSQQEFPSGQLFPVDENIRPNFFGGASSGTPNPPNSNPQAVSQNPQGRAIGRDIQNQALQAAASINSTQSGAGHLISPDIFSQINRAQKRVIELRLLKINMQLSALRLERIRILQQAERYAREDSQRADLQRQQAAADERRAGVKRQRNRKNV